MRHYTTYTPGVGESAHVEDAVAVTVFQSHDAVRTLFHLNFDRIVRAAGIGHVQKTVFVEGGADRAIDEPNGGQVRGFDTLFTQFVPALKKAGFTDADIHQFTVTNPANAFAIRVRSA